MKTVLDFGAVGDNDTDDAAAFNAALAWSEANSVPVVVPNGLYKIGTPLSVTTTRNHTTKWGLMGQGACLRAAYSDPTGHLISVLSRHISRFLTISGLTLTGVRTTGHGIYLAARELDGLTGSIYNANIFDLAIEGFNDGLHVNGEVFESFFWGIQSRDNARDGFRFGHGKDPVSGAQRGVCSAIFLSKFIAGQNGRYGVTTANYMPDLTVRDGYILLNQHYGLHLQNGSDKGIAAVGFENNFLSSTFGEDSAHVFSQNATTLDNCKAHNGMSTGAKWFLHKGPSISGNMHVRNCRKSRSGTQPSGLARLRGGGHTYFMGGSGDIVAEAPAQYTSEPYPNAPSRVTNIP